VKIRKAENDCASPISICSTVIVGMLMYGIISRLFPWPAPASGEGVPATGKSTAEIIETSCSRLLSIVYIPWESETRGSSRNGVSTSFTHPGYEYIENNSEQQVLRKACDKSPYDEEAEILGKKEDCRNTDTI
jgi:hypothetical protein